MYMRFVVLLTIAAQYAIATNDLSYNKNYYPWNSLYDEGELLSEFLEVEGLTEVEQMPLPSSTASITFKMVLEQSFTKEMEDVKSQNNTLALLVSDVLKNVTSTSNITSSQDIKVHSIRNFRKLGFPLVYGHITLKDEGRCLEMEKYLQTMLQDSTFPMTIARGRFTAVKGVEKDSVVHLVIQLLGEHWPYSMNDENSEYRLNITDVMLHLIQPKFKNIYGEHYYRTVISGLDKTLESLIVMSHVLLDPDSENLYYASKIWFSEYGYVSFGRWKLFPSNINVIRSRVVPLRYWEFLSDRSYLAPQSPQFMDSSPILDITLPVAIVLMVMIVTFLGVLSLVHYMAYGRNKKKYNKFISNHK